MEICLSDIIQVFATGARFRLQYRVSENILIIFYYNCPYFRMVDAEKSLLRQDMLVNVNVNADIFLRRNFREYLVYLKYGVESRSKN